MNSSGVVAVTAPDSWRLRLPGGRALELWEAAPEAGRVPQVMGILNITPDSFSDGGRWLDPRHAVERGLEMLAEGAAILDLGAESTRPGGGVYGAGASEVPAEQEWRRLAPVLEGLRAASDAVLSVDTRKAEVARRALAAGADVINDVGGLGDPELAAVAAEAGCPLVLMHSRGELSEMQRRIRFTDVVAEVRDELAVLVERSTEAGIDPAQLILDPGIGFGKNASQNLRLLAELASFKKLGRPVLLGASRKSFIAEASPAPPDRRLAGSLATVTAALAGRVAIVRVHDVFETVQYLKVGNAIHLASKTP